MNTLADRLAVCSWSLRPDSPQDLANKVRVAGLRRVQLALDPIRRGEWTVADTQSALRNAGIAIVSGMMGMEGEDYTTLESIRATGGVRRADTWATNLDHARGNASLARQLGVGLVTFHAGFLPHARRDSERAAIVSRLIELARVFSKHDVRVALETGQENARTLLAVLDDVNADLEPGQRVGVNFDPANMILYAMGDPVSALRRLLPHVVQVHIKDARSTKVASTWGQEVPVGLGEINWHAFFRTLEQSPRPVDLVIEREAGQSRLPDVIVARQFVESLSERRSARPPARRGPGVSRPSTIGVGVLGLGFMGRTHLRAYAALARRRAASPGQGPIPKIIAVCDEVAAQRKPGAAVAGNLGPGGTEDLWDTESTRVYHSASDLFADPDVQAVSICTPTDSHVEFTLAALNAGKHVLVEKPAVLDIADARTLLRAQQKAHRLCMPAMCMRFWPGWSWLKEACDSERFGRLTSLVIQRLGTTPGWSKGFYTNASRTGGAISDLHIHDSDLVLWLLGAPSSVSSAGSISHVLTQYHFSKHKDLLVSAEGSWDHAPGWSFQMRYVATFAKATAEFDLHRSEPLHLYRDGKCEPVAIPAGTGYDLEIEHFVGRVGSFSASRKHDQIVDLRDAGLAAALLSAERQSLKSRKPVRFSPPKL